MFRILSSSSSSILVWIGLFIVLLLLVESLPTTHAQDQDKRMASVFGTDGSYDSGGTDPLCFVSTYNTTNDDDGSDDDKTTTTTTISELNDLLFDDPSTSATVHLLKNCYSGTKLSVTTLNAPSDRELLAGIPYTFRLELETQLSTIHPALLVTRPITIDEQQQQQQQQGEQQQEGDDDDDDDGTSIQIWFRLLFCNALRVGFCQPLLDTRKFVDDLDASQTDLVPDKNTPENTNDYQQQQQGGGNKNVLKAIAGNDGAYVATRWVSWKLQPLDLEGDLYSATADISIILPNDAGGVYVVLGTYPTLLEYSRLD